MEVELPVCNQPPFLLGACRTPHPPPSSSPTSQSKPSQVQTLAVEIIYFGERRHLRYHFLSCGVIQNDSCSIQTAFEMGADALGGGEAKSSLWRGLGLGCHFCIQLSGKTQPSHTNPPRGSKHLRLLPIDRLSGPPLSHAIFVAVHSTVHVCRAIETRNRMQDCQPCSFNVACSPACLFSKDAVQFPNEALIRRSVFFCISILQRLTDLPSSELPSNLSIGTPPRLTTLPFR